MKSRDPKADTFAIQDTILSRFPDAVGWTAVVFTEEGAHVLGSADGRGRISPVMIDQAVERARRLAQQQMKGL